MLKFKKIFGDIDITRELILLLVIGGLYSLSISLSNTFVNVYLWKQSEDFRAIALFNLAIVVLQLITFTLAGAWAKKVDRVIVLRIGVIFLSIFFIAVLLTGEKASHFLLLLGGLLGVGYGFYWLAYNVLTFEITEPDTRDFFNGLSGALTSSGGMIGPIVAGFIITRFASNIGYTIIFAISFALFTAAVITSFFLQRRPSSGQYLFIRIIKERKHDYNWRRVTFAHFFQGIREGIFVFVITIYIFLVAKSEMGLGTYGLLHAATAFIMYSLATHLIKKEKRKQAMLFGGFILYASIFLILFDPSYVKMLIYGVVIGVGYPIMLVPYSSMTYDIIGIAWKAAEMRIEYVAVKELYLNIGRIVSILLFIVSISFFDPLTVIPILLIIVGAGHTIATLFMRKVAD